MCFLLKLFFRLYFMLSILKLFFSQVTINYPKLINRIISFLKKAYTDATNTDNNYQERTGSRPKAFSPISVLE